MPKQRQTVELLTRILRHLYRDQGMGNRYLGIAAHGAAVAVKLLRDTHPAYTPKSKIYKPKPFPF